MRELHEEVDVDLITPLSFLGLINDSKTPVGRVHIGAAYQATVRFRRMNEPDQFEHQWVQRDQVTLYEDRMEGWSKILWKEWIKPR
jgi:predicted NUDIX family phosphoesterase